MLNQDQPKIPLKASKQQKETQPQRKETHIKPPHPHLRFIPPRIRAHLLRVPSQETSRVSRYLRAGTSFGSTYREEEGPGRGQEAGAAQAVLHEVRLRGALGARTPADPGRRVGYYVR
ncbi:hypothetical protein ANO14919_140540 [Xylariales sp. No.14919]|nr:hypothetical protein ANO14919_140540 [Xylariales sp. No.14919]